MGQTPWRSWRWDRASEIFRRGGPGALLGRLLRRGLRRLVSWQTISFFVLDHLASLELPEVRARIPLHVRLAQDGDWELVRDFALRSGKTWADIEGRLRRGDLCIVGLSEGRLVHVSWIARASSWVPPIRATLRLERGEAYGYDSVTDEAARGHGVQPAIMNFVLRYEQANGYQRHFFYVDHQNYSGLRLLGKITDLSVTKTRTVRCLRIAGLGGHVLIGLGRGPGPRLQLPAAVRVRHLGPFGQWIRDAA